MKIYFEWRKYVHEVHVNCLFKLAQEKVWLGELTILSCPQLLFWDVKHQNKQTKFGQRFLRNLFLNIDGSPI